MRYTDAPARRAALLQDLEHRGYVSSRSAAVTFGVSEMTIRRDLGRLAADGLAHRVLGGASAAGSGLPFERRGAVAQREKQAVAGAVAALLAPGQVVALDAGTTVTALVPHLPAGVTVVSHSVPVLAACAERGDLGVVGLGGAYHPTTRSFTGPQTAAGLAGLAIDVAVLSAAAVDDRGLCSTDAWDAQTKQALAAAARTVVLAIDHAKLAASAPIRVLPLSAVDVVVVDEAASPQDLALLRSRCRAVTVARVEAP